MSDNERILFLDDSPERCAIFRARCPHAVIITTADECIRELQAGAYWDEVHLDHDLGGVVYQDSREANCGMAVVRWMTLNKPAARMVIVHTHNGPAGALMVLALQEVDYVVIRAPFRDARFAQ